MGWQEDNGGHLFTELLTSHIVCCGVWWPKAGDMPKDGKLLLKLCISVSGSGWGRGLVGDGYIMQLSIHLYDLNNIWLDIEEILCVSCDLLVAT